ncbi:multidrug efflux MFS transporter NorA [Caldifermentibacillus hisashii]|uniref:multidrug efflux MFS transporter NorA n=1 Tax=Caldifermentibacillus hisashii TaxID=996558 RepID=UPI002E1D05C5|nr:multidrug efflux MFS transporter NorA [Caldifermentibacillus hisashii]
MDKKKKVTLSILLANLFLAFLGIGLVVPVLPTIMNELSINGAVVGYMVAVFAFVQLISSPIAGRWADRYGRKRMIVIGLVIFGLSEFLFGIGKTVEVLFLSRMFGGLSSAFIMPAVTAFIADITTAHERPKALGYMSAAINTGFIIGPGLGGFLAEFSARLPFYVAGFLGVFAAILSFILLKEPERLEETKVQEHTQSTTWKVAFKPIYFIPLLLIFISSFGLSAFESLFSLFIDHKFGFSPKDIAIIIMGGGIIGAVGQVFLFDYLTKKIGEIRLIRWCFLFSSIVVFVMTIVNHYFSILLVTFIVFAGFDLIRPAVTTYLSKVAGNDQGFIGGMNSTFTSFGNIFGPIVGGMLFDINLNFPYYFSTIVLIIGTAMAMYWKEASAVANKNSQ